MNRGGKKIKRFQRRVDLINRIDRHYLSLSKTERKVGDYVKKKYLEAQYFTLSDFSKELNIGKTSIIRFSQKIGFEGFTNFKESLIHYASTCEEAEVDKSKNENQLEYRIKKLTEANVKSILETSKLINVKDLERSVNQILSSNRVFLIGVGSSGITALDTKHKLLHIGINADAITDVQLMDKLHLIVDREDTVIGLSVSGETENVIHALRSAKNNGANIIVVTYTAGSAITEFTDTLLTSAARDWDKNSGAFAAKMGQLQVMDILFKEVNRHQSRNQQKGERRWISL